MVVGCRRHEKGLRVQRPVDRLYELARAGWNVAQGCVQ
jgi:hypothetical protein